AQIAELTRALAGAVTGRDVVAVVEEYARPLFGAIGTGFWVHEGGRLYSFGTTGYSKGFVRYMEETPPPARCQSPAGQTLFSRVPNFVSSPEEYIDRYPQMAEVPAVSGKKAWAFLPLIASGRPIAVCIISYDRPHTFT